jgi:signal transduction histidine kinase
LTDAGRDAIEHILADPPPPVVLMARAMLADATATTFHAPAASAGTHQAASWARLLGHELRHTLGPIRELLDLVQQDGIPEHLERRHTRALAAVERLADLGRSTHAMAGIGGSAETRFRLGHALEEAWSATRAERNGHLTLQVDGDDAWLLGPKERLVMALVNLIRNAKAAAVTAGRSLTFRATTTVEATAVVLRVEDDGPGIPADLAGRIFERGVSGTGGTGEGLALVREILERELRGTISLATSRDGGAAFVLRLPHEEAR